MRAVLALFLLLLSVTAGAGNAQSPGSTVRGRLRMDCQILQQSAPRGLACLHCSQPQARRQAIAIRNILLEACLENIAVNYLVDGTFLYDEQFLMHELSHLTAGGRRLHVVLYLLNGCAQRGYYQRTDAFLAMSPEEFRSRLARDSSLHTAYMRHVELRRPLIARALQLGASVTVVPMLEDNLDGSSFEQLAELTARALPAEWDIRFGRSPCPRCHAGNDGDIHEGIQAEWHTIRANRGIQGGIITNDGFEYYSSSFPRPPLAVVHLDDLRSLAARAGQLDNTFILWSARRQGIEKEGMLPPPAERRYEIPSPGERRELLRFLRGAPAAEQRNNTRRDGE